MTAMSSNVVQFIDDLDVMIGRFLEQYFFRFICDRWFEQGGKF